MASRATDLIPHPVELLAWSAVRGRAAAACAWPRPGLWWCCASPGPDLAGDPLPHFGDRLVGEADQVEVVDADDGVRKHPTADQ